MKKRVIKLIVCIMLISALMVGFCSAYASAATPAWILRAKAGIAAAMLAADLAIAPINAALDDTLLESIDPVGYVSEIQDTPWVDYIDRSVITVRPDVVTIDGVEYSEIWLGPDAANELRLKGFDFVTAYNILSNQDTPVTYADGLGFVDDLGIYSVDGVRQSQIFEYPYSGTGEWSYGFINPYMTNNNNRYQIGFTYDGSPTQITEQGYTDWNYYNPHRIRFIINNRNVPYLQTNTRNSSSWSNYQGFPDEAFVSEPFTFDYTSGVLDPEPVEDGLMLRVPSSYDAGEPTSVFNYDIHDLINIYPQVNDTQGHELVFDPSLNPDFETDLDMGNALGDLITAVILAKLADLLGDDSQVIYAPFPEQPEPGPHPGVIDPLPDPDPAPEDPTAGTTIADTDWTKLDEILRWIQSTIDSIRHLTESLQTMLDSIFDAIQSIPEAIRELADKILEDIELGPAKLFDKALDILKTLFLPLLLPIRAMMNLWHYVVEWINSISTSFTWIFGIMSGTSGNMVLPIYALLAGGICISIYKALGR